MNRRMSLQDLILRRSNGNAPGTLYPLGKKQSSPVKTAVAPAIAETPVKPRTAAAFVLPKSRKRKRADSSESQQQHPSDSRTQSPSPPPPPQSTETHPSPASEWVNERIRILSESATSIDDLPVVCRVMYVMLNASRVSVMETQFFRTSYCTLFRHSNDKFVLTPADVARLAVTCKAMYATINGSLSTDGQPPRTRLALPLLELSKKMKLLPLQVVAIGAYASKWCDDPSYGGILALKMGLGKTRSAIALAYIRQVTHLYLENKRVLSICNRSNGSLLSVQSIRRHESSYVLKTLIVCPVNAMSTWYDELYNCMPRDFIGAREDKRVIQFKGAARRHKDLRDRAFVIISYETLSRELDVCDPTLRNNSRWDAQTSLTDVQRGRSQIYSILWDVVILDESHALKRDVRTGSQSAKRKKLSDASKKKSSKFSAISETLARLVMPRGATSIHDDTRAIHLKTALAVGLLKRTCGMCCTGTPQHDTALDMAGQFRFLNHGPLSTAEYWAEYQRWSSLIESDNTYSNSSFMQQHRKLLSEYVIRYEDEQMPVQCRLNLPELISQVEQLEMSRAQLLMLSFVRDKANALIGKWKQSHGSEASRQYKNILACITEMRKIHISPELLRDTEAEQYLQQHWPEHEWNVDDSPKIGWLVAKRKRLLQETNPPALLIVISEYNNVLDLASKYMGIDKPMMITGRKLNVREATLHRFRSSNHSEPLFVNLLCANAGTNLVTDGKRAETVFVEPYYQPQIEKQAENRTCRIGQKYPVHITRLITVYKKNACGLTETGETYVQCSAEEWIQCLKSKKLQRVRQSFPVPEGSDDAKRDDINVSHNTELDKVDSVDMFAWFMYDNDTIGIHVGDKGQALRITGGGGSSSGGNIVNNDPILDSPRAVAVTQHVDRVRASPVEDVDSLSSWIQDSIETQLGSDTDMTDSGESDDIPKLESDRKVIDLTMSDRVDDSDILAFLNRP